MTERFKATVGDEVSEIDDNGEWVADVVILEVDRQNRRAYCEYEDGFCEMIDFAHLDDAVAER